MSEMVERVARAIAEAGRESDVLFYPVGKRAEQYAAIARAAIEAMREPTAEMVESGLKKPQGMTDWPAALGVAWRAMIDVAQGN